MVTLLGNLWVRAIFRLEFPIIEKRIFHNDVIIFQLQIETNRVDYPYRGFRKKKQNQIVRPHVLGAHNGNSGKL